MANLEDPGVLSAYFDGLCLPTNPGGYACGGWFVPEQAARPNQPQITGSRCYAHGTVATNNYAEYRAAISCLKAIYRAGYRGQVLLHGDSNLVVEQYMGRYDCKAASLRVFLERLRELARDFVCVEMLWIPRAENQMADKLSRNGFREAAAMVEA